jgi:hypothetical protein
MDAPGDGLQRATLPDQRRGLLTQGSLLSMTAYQRVTSAVRRGLLVRHKFLCDPVPPPPPDLTPEIDLVDPLIPAAERLAETHEGACYGCHRLVNPIGFGFEHFDAVGRYRETLGDRPIDATGVIVGGLDPLDGADVSFDGVLELGSMLAEESRVLGCVGHHWLERASRRERSHCGVLDAVAAVCESGNLRDFVVHLVKTEAFRFVSYDIYRNSGSTPDDDCPQRGTADCAALVAAGAEVSLRTCEACQGAPCDTPGCAGFHCAGGIHVLRGCCDDDDCSSLGTFCAIATGPNLLCANDSF